MADVHEPEVRNNNMIRSRGKDTIPEMLDRKFLFSAGFRFKGVLILGLNLFILLAVSGQSISVHNINKNNGLSGNSITAIDQDHFGIIWIGTKNGLNRYDGRTIKQFNSDNSNLSSSDINDILITSNDSLYISTANGGLYRYDFNTENIMLISDSDIQILKFYETSSGEIFIGTSSGLYKYRESSLLEMTGSLKGSNNEFRVQDILESQSGDIWIATFNNGLFKLAGDSIESILSEVHGAKLGILSLETADSRSIWLGTQNKGLLQYDFIDGSVTDKNYIINHETKTVRQVENDADGYWIATEGAGAYYYMNNGLNRSLYRDTKKFISERSATEVYIDNRKNVWLGTAWNGISIISFNQKSGFVYDVPTLSIYMDKTYSLIGTDGQGLFRIHENNNYNPVSLLGAKYIQFIIKKPQENRFWLGTFSNGLIEFDWLTGKVEKFQNQINDNSISFNDVRDIELGSDGSLWIATWGGGLNQYNPETKKWTQHYYFGSNTSNKVLNIVDLLMDDKGVLYMATFGNGVIQFNTITKESKNLDIKDSIDNGAEFQNVLSMYQDRHGGIWIGYWEDGLVKFDPENNYCHHYYKEITLGRKTIVSIIEDFHGNMWFGTKNGILSLDQETQKFFSYSEFNGEYHIKSCYIDSSGVLYFGGTMGIVSFDPALTQREEDSLKVVFVDFKLFGKAVGLDQGILSHSIMVEDIIHLDHDQNTISFGFNAIDFPTNHGITYQIKMEGLDDEWNNIENQSSANYANLKPGLYHFIVRAYRDQNLVGESSVNIVIKKPFWTTWVAYGLYTLIIILIILGIVKMSIAWERIRSSLQLEKVTHQKDLEMHEIKQRFFINISHEIRTPITVILGTINQILKEGSVPRIFSDKLKVIRKSGDYLFHLVNELLDYRKMEANQVELSISEVNVREFAQELYIPFVPRAEENGLKYDLRLSVGNEILWCDSFQIEKAVYNLLSNAFKYTEAGGRIDFRVEGDDEFIFFTVADTGIGIPKLQHEKVFDRFYQSDSPITEEKGFGIGLSVVKDIVKLHQGEITLLSDEGHGSSFTIKLPKRNYLHYNKVTASEQEAGEKWENITFQDQESQSTDLKILIVEDHSQIRNQLVDLFNKSYTVMEAKDGVQGFAVAIKEIPDLIISDILMPLKDGIQLTKELKGDQRTCHIPIVLLTARTGTIYKLEGFETGADEYISKPFNPKLLVSRIRNLLDTRKKLWERYKADFLTTCDKLEEQNPDDKFLLELRKLIQDNIMEDELNPEFLAKELGMSHSVIYKKIKFLTGMSIVEFIREYKLSLASELLSKYNCSVKEACYRAGFSDRRYFSRVFKAKYGKSPSEI